VGKASAAVVLLFTSSAKPVTSLAAGSATHMSVLQQNSSCVLFFAAAFSHATKRGPLPRSGVAMICLNTLSHSSSQYLQKTTNNTTRLLTTIYTAAL
jgi:hypothetical protein